MSAVEVPQVTWGTCQLSAVAGQTRPGKLGPTLVLWGRGWWGEKEEREEWQLWCYRRHSVLTLKSCHHPIQSVCLWANSSTSLSLHFWSPFPGKDGEGYPGLSVSRQSVSYWEPCVRQSRISQQSWESSNLYTQAHEVGVCVRKRENGWEEVWERRSVSQKGRMGLSAQVLQTRRRSRTEMGGWNLEPQNGRGQKERRAETDNPWQGWPIYSCPSCLSVLQVNCAHCRTVIK